MKLLWFLCILSAYTLAFGEWFQPKGVVIVFDYANFSDSQIRGFAQGLTKNGFIIGQKFVTLNFSIVPSFNPDNYATFGTFDLGNEERIYNVLAEYNKQNNKESGFLKALLKAVEISPNHGYLPILSNSKPGDEHLMREITLKIIQKDIEVDYTSRFPPIIIQNENSIESYTIYLIKKVKDLERLYTEAYDRLDKCSRNSITTTTEHAPIQNDKNIAGYVYDVINATENDISNITNTMAQYYVNRQQPGSVKGFPLLNSFTPNSPIFLDNTKGYTAEDFRNYIASGNVTSSSTTSLKALLKALDFASIPNTKIIYFTDNLPNDKYEIFSQLMFRVNHNKVKVEFQRFGELSHEEPALHRAISFAPGYPSV